MTEHDPLGPHGPDDKAALTRALRRIYAAPAEDGYWRALQARILARVAGEPAPGDGWWLPLARWARVGALAAAAALLIAGVTLWREREAREQYALETVLLQANAPHAQLTAAAGATPDGDAVLRYVLTP